LKPNTDINLEFLYKNVNPIPHSGWIQQVNH